jgi:hypothetical protein
MTHKPLIDYFDERIVNAIDSRRVADLMSKWDEVKKQTIYYDYYKWHTFCYKAYNCVEGRIAINQYLRRRATEYYIVPELRRMDKETAFISTAKPPAKFVWLRRDFYVFPENLAWTMAFPHEYKGLGPYFAKHKDFDTLNKQNCEAFNAMQKGVS